MARLTYLEMVQDILSDMDSDTVTTILETVESTQVTQIIETTYYNIIDGRDWPNLYQMFRLTETGISTPTHMTLGTTVMDLKYVKYNTRTATDTKDRYTEMQFLEPQEFMNIVDGRNSAATNVTQVTDTSNIKINVYKDRAPIYFTSFNETVLIFDAYDEDVETFLKTAKNQCYGKVYPTVTTSDGFYFDLPPDAFSYLLNEAKSTCFLTLKQQQNNKAEQHAVTQRRRMSQEAWKLRNGISYPNYGRKSTKFDITVPPWERNMK